MDVVIYTVTGLLKSVVLPPTVFYILIAIGLWRCRDRRWARWLAGVSLAALALLSTNAVVRLIVEPFERASPALDAAATESLPKSGALIVILGGGIRLGAQEYPEGETLSPFSLARVRYGVRLARATGLPLAVTGGKTSRGAVSEAALMKAFIERELGQPVLIAEDASWDTRQNAEYTIALAGRERFPTVIIVTDALHMHRAAHAFEATGVNVIRAPMDFRAAAPLRFPDFLPSMESLWTSTYVVHEWLGEIWYSLRRALG